MTNRFKDTDGQKTLVFVELPNQVDSAINAITDRQITNYSLVALTPHVEYALGEMSIPYKTPEDYHSEEEINAVGLEDFPFLHRFCSNVDSFLQEEWGFLKENDIQPARWNWYYLKNLINNLSIRSFILQRLFETERPHQILYFASREAPINRDLSFTRESTWSRMIPLVSASALIQAECLGGNTDPSTVNSCSVNYWPGSSGPFKNVVRRFLSPSGIRLARYNLAKVKLLKQRLLSLRVKKPRSYPNIMVLDTRYSVQHLLAKIKNRDSLGIFYWDAINRLPPVYLNSPGVRRHPHAEKKSFLTPVHRPDFRKLWESAKPMLEQSSLTTLAGVDCFPILERQLKHFFEESVPQMVDAYVEARYLLKRESCGAVLAAVMGDYTHQAIAKAAKKENIPYIVYRHGDTMGHVWTNSNSTYAYARSLMYIGHNELRTADYVLAFGEGDVGFLESTEGATAKVIPVGSSALDQLKTTTTEVERESLLKRNGLSGSKKTVVYVLTSMEGNLRIAPYRSRSPSRAFYLEKRLVEVFAEYPDFQFVLKIHSTAQEPFSPIARLVYDHGIENCVVSTEPFTSLLPVADMFITDYPSTTFLEMLTTDRPILFCGHDLPKKFNPDEWHPSNLDMWKERVVYADDLEDFLALLRNHLTDGNFQRIESEDKILKLYGTHLNDGKSADRAHDILETLAKGYAVA